MRDYVQATLGLGLALGLYTILGRVAAPYAHLVSLFTLAVVYFAQKKGDLFGAIVGSAAGLVVDSYSLGVFGISGLTLTVTGFLAGFISRKFNLLSFPKTFLFLGVMTLFESVLWLGMVVVILSEPFGRPMEILLIRPLVTAALGAVFFTWLRGRRARHG